MRALLVAALAVFVVVVPAPVAAPHVGGTAFGPWVGLWGPGPGPIGTFTYTVITGDPNLIFFRFDLDVDGRWDFPSQAGGGPIGIWATWTSVTKQHTEPTRGACVQAWDGVSTRLEGGVYVAKGPIGCTTFLTLTPDQWSRQSQGRFVWARFDVPSWLDPAGFGRRRAEVEGLRALPWPPVPHPGEDEGLPWLFRVNRQDLTDLLGPGTHTVHIILPWEGATFTAWDTVTIL
jgi:hypothetical protein